MHDKLIEHKEDVIKLLSGGLGEGMTTQNYESRVNAAIAATSYAHQRLLKIYSSKMEDIHDIPTNT